MSAALRAPLIAHIVFRFDYGGLENGLVNLINHMPESAARHVVIGLTEVTEFATRVKRSDTQIHAIGKKPGKDFGAYVRLFRLLRRIKPDVVHTRNIGTMDCQVVAMLAGVRRRIHSEHGWDTTDQEGQSGKYRSLRRLLAPFVDRFVALSAEIETWLVKDIGIKKEKILRICNGVDTTRFEPKPRAHANDALVIGTIARLSEIKDPLNIVLAFARLRSAVGNGRRIQLLVVGDGPLMSEVRAEIHRAGLSDDVRLAGSQIDVAPWLHEMDVFVLGSRREGISNTILEAMATGLPVVATRTGGNLELVEDGVTGALVPPQSADALAAALQVYVIDDALRATHGAAGRIRVVNNFSLDAMVARYASLYGDGSN